MSNKLCKTKITDPITGTKHGFLTWTSDMAAWSFSLPAGKHGSCPLAIYENHDDGSLSICGSCYAQIGRYGMPNVLDAQYARFRYVKKCLETSAGRRELENLLVSSIQSHVKNGHFRFFDSGDFHHPSMIRLLYRVCRRLPTIKFWFPTRVWHSPSASWQNPLRRLAALPNVAVRPSALHFDKSPPVIEGLAAGTTAVSENSPVFGNLCPKTEFGGNCETNNCRTCWSTKTEVSYLVHGWMGRHKPADALSDKIQSRRAAYANLTVNGTNI